MDNNLSRNFTLSELIKSNTASRWGFNEQYTPPVQVIDNLRELCIHVLQPIRDLIGRPIKVTSGYRSPRVNAKVGGASRKVGGKVIQTSQHVYGQAADIEVWVDGLEANSILINAIKELMADPKFVFDQCILEYGTLNNPSWIHISYVKGNNRMQVLRKESGRPYTAIRL